MSPLTSAIEAGLISGRLWFYTNYHCNLACRYCLTESSPSTPHRALELEKMLEIATQAEKLGFTGFGLTGGEPFLRRDMVDVIDALSDVLPVTVLTNGTLFATPRSLTAIERLAGKPVRLQISLDHPEPVANDDMRGPGNFAKVVAAIPELLARGLHVRVASTLPETDGPEAAAIRHFVAQLGVPSDDHVVRPIVDRGRAGAEGLGVTAPLATLAPELTLTTKGAFWTPFAPTYRDGLLQKDLLITPRITPLQYPVDKLLGLLDQVPRAAGDAGAGFV